MQVTAEMVSTLGGTNFPLDQRIADALMNYAQQAADAEGIPRQTWVRRAWKMADYEAKDILKGKASKAHYERILKLRGEHGGWPVGLAVTGAVIGQPLHEFFKAQTERAAKEAANAMAHEKLARAAYGNLLVGPGRSGSAGNLSASTREAGNGPGEVGARKARRLGGSR